MQNEHLAMTLIGHKTRAVFDLCSIALEAELADAITKLGKRRSGT